VQCREGRGEGLDALSLAQFRIGKVEGRSGSDVAAFAFADAPAALRAFNFLRALASAISARGIPRAAH